MKQFINDLAFFGGIPAFKSPLYVGCPNIGNRDHLIKRINDILDRKWLSNHGPCVQELEQSIAHKIGVKHCITMCNGTVALEIVIRALGLSGEIIVPSFTFIATAHALQWQEISPVFCDVDRHTHNINPAQIEKLITPRTSGIIGVHLWGRACEVQALTDIAHRHNLKLVFDAAHAFGCSYQGKMIGSFGHAEVFSFHATKFFNTFEGGAVVTNDDALADKIRLMNNFGFAGYDHVIYIGTNGKMTEIAAAMGLTSLESMDEFITINYRNYHHYQQQLADIAGISMMTYDENERNNFQYIVLEIDEATTHISRDQLADILWAENVIVRRYFYPGCHLMEPYHSLYPQEAFALQNTETLSLRVLSLPTGTSVNQDDINKICQIIRFVISQAKEIIERVIQK
ncbi:MAG: aminotransferase class I/II-fold pyridoxal phosphate-dependent enzyme [Saprospiraceae bacterium]